MPSLFEQNGYSERPLADRMRPVDFSDFFGQEHLISTGKPLRKMIDEDTLTSVILWGPPGTGKTTIARIVAAKTNSNFEEFSAVTGGINDLRRVVKESKERIELYQKKTILFVDEIHRFNKSQQDGFLPHIENGTLILIGATTENPGFEINSALLSRSMLLELKKLRETDLTKIIDRTLTNTERGLGKLRLKLTEGAKSHLVKVSNGDARNVITALEIASKIYPKNKQINEQMITEAYSKRILSAYKKGDNHYDVISAFIKSLRGSSPDAAIYWLARMLESGEDPKFIARRMIIFASEDIGNAAPMALVLANATFQAVCTVGLPEARLNLAQCTTYLASAPKSNASYQAISEAENDVKNETLGDVPIHLKNAPTKFAKDLDYGKDYLYPHNYSDNWVKQDYLPEHLKDKKYYRPSKNGAEKEISERLKNRNE